MPSVPFVVIFTDFYLGHLIYADKVRFQKTVLTKRRCVAGFQLQSASICKADERAGSLGILPGYLPVTETQDICELRGCCMPFVFLPYPGTKRSSYCGRIPTGTTIRRKNLEDHI